jgi:hypothetical protein
VDLRAQANLIVASLDLQLVRLLRGAMLAADLAGAEAGSPCSAIPSAASAPRDRFEPTPRFEPRKVHHPTPRFEPRPVFHDRIDIDVAASDTSSPAQRSSDHGPLPAPWQQPVWNLPLQPAPMVKVHIHRTDVHNKGSLIDLFC